MNKFHWCGFSLLGIMAMSMMVSCGKSSDENVDKLFEKMESDVTGIDFVNTVPENDTLNQFIYHYLYNLFPLLTAFRDPWAKFIPYVIFSYIILISITMNKLSSFFKIFTLIISLILILIYVNKKIYYNDNYGVMRTTHVAIPEYWKKRLTL